MHGWGIFARKSIPPDTPLFEYRGDSVRSLVADLREARYRVEGRDCYLFRLNDDAVLDATTLGSISRFTNHCCQPSLYTRVRSHPLPLLAAARKPSLSVCCGECRQAQASNGWESNGQCMLSAPAGVSAFLLSRTCITSHPDPHALHVTAERGL